MTMDKKHGKSSRVHPSIEQEVNNILRMLDSQFIHKNKSENGGFNLGSSTIRSTPQQPGISVIVAPTTALSTPDIDKLTDPRRSLTEGRKIQVIDNMSTTDRITLCAAEAGGTAILVFLGCMGCVSLSGTAIPHEQISLTFGLAVMIAIQVFGHISGAHINPLVTVAAATLGNIPLIQVPIYFVGQTLGALAGYGLLKATTPSHIIQNASDPNDYGICSPGLNANLTSIQGFLVEFLISLILALVCCGVWDRRNSTKHDSTPIRFGFTIACLAFAAGPYTGANMNPVRSFAPALMNGAWDNHWIYWVAPLSAGFLGALLYRLLFNKNVEESEQNNIPESIPLNDKP